MIFASNLTISKFVIRKIYDKMIYMTFALYFYGIENKFIIYFNLKQKFQNLFIYVKYKMYVTFMDDKFFLVSVDDASGRFTNGFFWGNTYFTGSATECSYIGKSPSHYTYSKQHIEDPKVSTFEEVRKFNTEPRKRINSGFSGINLWTETDPIKTPFQLGFYMLKLSINVTYTPVSIIDMQQIYNCK